MYIPQELGKGVNVQGGKLTTLAEDGTPPRCGERCYIIVLQVFL